MVENNEKEAGMLGRKKERGDHLAEMISASRVIENASTNVDAIVREGRAERVLGEVREAVGRYREASAAFSAAGGANVHEPEIDWLRRTAKSARGLSPTDKRRLEMLEEVDLLEREQQAELRAQTLIAALARVVADEEAGRVPLPPSRWVGHDPSVLAVVASARFWEDLSSGKLVSGSGDTLVWALHEIGEHPAGEGFSWSTNRHPPHHFSSKGTHGVSNLDVSLRCLNRLGWLDAEQRSAAWHVQLGPASIEEIQLFREWYGVESPDRTPPESVAARMQRELVEAGS